MEIVWNIMLLAVSFFLLSKGADYFVDGASGIAEKLKIPQIIIGLTIVAMGTSAPEAAVSISAALEGNAAITIGNIVGSNILNILIILGISSAITTLAVGKDTNFVDIPVMLGATIILFALGFDGGINYIDGIIFLVIFVLYLAYLFIIARSRINKREEAIARENLLAADGETTAEAEAQAKKRSLIVAIGLAVMGLILIIVGSDIAVESATFLAREMGVSDRFIGLTVVALGTSLPELFTSVTAAIKKNADIAIGNIVGSNIFNILFVVGLSSVIISVPFASAFIVDMIVAIGAGVLLWIFSLHKKKLIPIHGVVFLLAYAGYFAYLMMK